MKVSHVGPFDPSVVKPRSCEECEILMLSQGATDIYYVSIGRSTARLCERHLEDLIVAIDKERANA